MVSECIPFLSERVPIVRPESNPSISHRTSDPLNWFSPVTGRPEFFVDLLETDWRWYEVCTYKNGTSEFVSIEDPFEAGLGEEEEEEGDEEELVCPFAQNALPFICEEQAMRGCNFDDGAYSPETFPCSFVDLHFRLKSDFFLKADPTLLPHAEAFAKDDDLLAEKFGQAYHKLTHAGLHRCGLSGSCAGGGKCQVVKDQTTGRYLSAQCIFDEALLQDAVDPSIENNSAELDYDDDDEWGLSKEGSIVLLVCFGLMILGTTLLAVRAQKTVVHKKPEEKEEKKIGENVESSTEYF